MQVKLTDEQLAEIERQEECAESYDELLAVARRVPFLLAEIRALKAETEASTRLAASWRSVAVSHGSNSDTVRQIRI